MLATAILPRDESAAIQTDSAAIMPMSASLRGNRQNFACGSYVSQICHILLAAYADV